jgi:DNA-directed RNA polymerase II subunit RPB1
MEMSGIKIETSDLFDSNGEPKPNGLFDPRMGPHDLAHKCTTCMKGAKDCPGHFGYLELKKPVYHPGYIKLIRKILNCVCWDCGKLLCKRDQRFAKAMRETGDKRLSEIYELCKTIKICSLKEKKTKNKNNEEDGEDITEEKQDQGCDYLQPKCKKISK